MDKKTRKIIFIVAALVVLALLFVFYKNSKKADPITSQNELVQTDGELSKIDENTQTLSNENQPVKTDNSKDFNVSMDLARSAMLKSDYALAISYYNKAISYNKNDSAPHVGLYTIYLNQKNWQKALDSINQAIKISPIFGDYWNWKILVMDQGLNKSYVELRVVYDQGYPQVRTQEKVNLATKFAMISEKHGQKDEAIKLWQKAMELSPEKKSIYQAEIDRLNK